MRSMLPYRIGISKYAFRDMHVFMFLFVLSLDDVCLFFSHVLLLLQSGIQNLDLKGSTISACPTSFMYCFLGIK